MRKREKLSLSFNVTKRCGNSCKHCYRTAFNEKEADLSIDLFKIVLDDLKTFEDKYFVNFDNLLLVGGDPLLHKNWKQLLLEIKKRKKKFAILGNPETLSEDNVKFLKDLNILSFQLSLDGLKKTHDYCRYQGSFDKTFEKIDLLSKYKIPINITFTLFPYNSEDLLDLMDLLVEKNIAVNFFLSLGRNMGNAKSFDKVFSKKGLKEIIEKFLDKVKEIEKTNCKASFSTTTAAFPCHLGDGNKYNNLILSYLVSGCGLGFGIPRIMTDGSLVPCPFITKSIGKIPEKSFEDIFLGNVLMRKYRRREFFLGCRNCSYYLSCRGCPAITYATKKNEFDKYPLCNVDEAEVNKSDFSKFLDYPSIKCSNKQEWGFIKQYNEKMLSNFIVNESFQKKYLYFQENENEKERFLENPEKYSQENKISLSKKECLALLDFLKTSSDSTDKYQEVLTERKKIFDQIALLDL